MKSLNQKTIIAQLEKENHDLKAEIAQLKKSNNTNNSQVSDLYEDLKKKDKEIAELKNKLSRFPFELNNGERLLSVIFYYKDKNIYHSIICKNTDKFNRLEEKFYEQYPELSELELRYKINDKKIHRFKTLEENLIKNSDIINIEVLDY